MERLFRHHGHHTTHCNDGRHGLFLLTTGDWDGAVVDLVLPHLSGWDVVDALKTELVHKHVPVVVVSGYAWVCPVDWEDVPVMTKPYQFDELLKVCEERFTPRKTVPCD